MFYVSKLVQAFGVADVGYALFVGLSEAHAMGRELRLMLLGVVVFYVGRFMERRAAAHG